MKMDNFVSFAIVNGFFIGLILSVLKYDAPLMIVLFTLFTTLGFYLIITLSASFFVKYFDFQKGKLNKKSHDGMLEYFITEFDKRESVYEQIKDYIRSINLGANSEEAGVKEQQRES